MVAQFEARHPSAKRLCTICTIIPCPCAPSRHRLWRLLSSDNHYARCRSVGNFIIAGERLRRRVQASHLTCFLFRCTAATA
eukprot:5487919-Pleurochrysis_carterae.AAC.1